MDSNKLAVVVFQKDENVENPAMSSHLLPFVAKEALALSGPLSKARTGSPATR